MADSGTALNSVLSIAVEAAQDAGVPMVQPAADLLRTILGIEDAQTALLRSIDQKVQRLIDGPWERAHRYVRDAQLPGRTAKQRREGLLRARDALFEAIPLQPQRSWPRAACTLDLALLSAALGDFAPLPGLLREVIEHGVPDALDAARKLARIDPKRDLGSAELKTAPWRGWPVAWPTGTNIAAMRAAGSRSRPARAAANAWEMCNLLWQTQQTYRLLETSATLDVPLFYPCLVTREGRNVNYSWALLVWWPLAAAREIADSVVSYLQHRGYGRGQLFTRDWATRPSSLWARCTPPPYGPAPPPNYYSEILVRGVAEEMLHRFADDAVIGPERQKWWQKRSAHALTELTGRRQGVYSAWSVTVPTMEILRYGSHATSFAGTAQVWGEPARRPAKRAASAGTALTARTRERPQPPWDPKALCPG